MWEIHWCIDCIKCDCLCFWIVQVEFSWIFLHDVYLKIWVNKWLRCRLNHLTTSNLRRTRSNNRNNLLRCLAITSLSMLEYFVICSLNTHALGAGKNELLEDFLYNTMHISQILIWATHFASPFTFCCYLLLIAFMTKDRIAFRALLWLKDYECTYFTEEVVNDIW